MLQMSVLLVIPVMSMLSVHAVIRPLATPVYATQAMAATD